MLWTRPLGVTGMDISVVGLGSWAVTLIDTWSPGTTLVDEMTIESITGTAFWKASGGVAC